MCSQNLFQDWRSNPHDARIRCVLVAFRLAQWLHRRVWLVRVICIPYFLAYRVLVHWFCHMELQWTLDIGEGLQIFHGYCLVIHPNTRIGRHVTLRHCVTLGNRSGEPEAPIMEDYVEVGAQVVILGGVTVGRHAIVGAGSVVTKSVPPYAIVAGVPARVVKFRWDVDTILRHEEAFYPPERRLTRETLSQMRELKERPVC